MENLPTGKINIDLEAVDEVRLYPTSSPAPVPLEPGELPSSYGGNRLVLLPVDPYLMHVYWNLDSTAQPAAGVRALLRFYESGDTLETRSFDVDMDLSAPGWYVHLWSPNKIYSAEIGWMAEDGEFIPLASSDSVRTPPAWPRPTESAMQPQAAEAGETACPTIGSRGLALVAGRPLGPLSPAVFEFFTPSHGHGDLPSRDCQGADVPVGPPPVTVAGRLERRLAELYALRGELPPMPQPVEFAIPQDEFPSEPPGLTEPDLTEWSEERFTPGISSARDPLGE